MKSTLSNVLIFTVGAAIGSAVTWTVLKTIYEKRLLDEIESVKEVFSYKKEDDIDVADEVTTEEATVEEEIEFNEAKPMSVKEYAAKLASQGYTNYSNPERKELTDKMTKPYVIPPEEFGERDGYDTLSFTYYADRVLADDMDERVIDVDSIVGEESLGTFGEYEDDSVFVRNDELKCDYEILLDSRNYSDIYPHRVEE